LAGATNPAGLLLVGNRFDVGLALFRPVRYGTITSPSPAAGAYDGNRVTNFELPELGYSLQYRPKLALGVAIYGNGGLNTSYKTPIPLLGSDAGRREYRASVHFAYPGVQGGRA
jgi:long-chain fatty acid transport protein